VLISSADFDLDNRRREVCFSRMASCDYMLTRPSISDHMCRMALMAMMIPTDASRPLDIPRCVMVRNALPSASDTAKLTLQMALVHDLAEAQ
jgi:5'-deoxynucleotidase YfbR-like HD superfamily hydrolase